MLQGKERLHHADDCSLTQPTVLCLFGEVCLFQKDFCLLYLMFMLFTSAYSSEWQKKLHFSNFVSQQACSASMSI